MRCEDAIEQIRTGGAQAGDNLKAAMAHAKDCEDCQAALRALDALRPLRDEPAPIPSDGAMERAIDRALSSTPVQRYRRGFWSGLASGAALAATLAAVAVGVWLQSSDRDATGGVPEVRLVLNQPHSVTVSLEST
jgi:ferric-dicitrate binding protein FerR (iron transport regulator)